MNHKVKVGAEEEGTARAARLGVRQKAGRRGRSPTLGDGHLQAGVRELGVCSLGPASPERPLAANVGRRSPGQAPQGLGRMETVVGLAARRVLGDCRRGRALAVKYEGGDWWQ